MICILVFIRVVLVRITSTLIPHAAMFITGVAAWLAVTSVAPGVAGSTQAAWWHRFLHVQVGFGCEADSNLCSVRLPGSTWEPAC